MGVGGVAGLGCGVALEIVVYTYVRMFTCVCIYICTFVKKMDVSGMEDLECVVTLEIVLLYTIYIHIHRYIYIVTPMYMCVHVCIYIYLYMLYIFGGALDRIVYLCICV